MAEDTKISSADTNAAGHVQLAQGGSLNRPPAGVNESVQLAPGQTAQLNFNLSDVKVGVAGDDLQFRFPDNSSITLLDQVDFRQSELPSRLKFEFDPADVAQTSKVDDNLVITFKDDSQIRLNDYYEVASG